MNAPIESFYTEDQKAELLADVRELLQEYPFLASRGAEAVRRMLRMLHGLAVSEFEVSLALEALTIENEVLA